MKLKKYYNRHKGKASSSSKPKSSEAPFSKGKKTTPILSKHFSKGASKIQFNIQMKEERMDERGRLQDEFREKYLKGIIVKERVK